MDTLASTEAIVVQLRRKIESKTDRKSINQAYRKAKLHCAVANTHYCLQLLESYNFAMQRLMNRGAIGRVIVASYQSYIVYGKERGLVSENRTEQSARSAYEKDQRKSRSSGFSSDAVIWAFHANAWHPIDVYAAAI